MEPSSELTSLGRTGQLVAGLSTSTSPLSDMLTAATIWYCVDVSDAINRSQMFEQNVVREPASAKTHFLPITIQQLCLHPEILREPKSHVLPLNYIYLTL
jgi:hypothetical protein